MGLQATDNPTTTWRWRVGKSPTDRRRKKELSGIDWPKSQEEVEAGVQENTPEKDKTDARACWASEPPSEPSRRMVLGMLAGDDGSAKQWKHEHVKLTWKPNETFIDRFRCHEQAMTDEAKSGQHLSSGETFS